METGTAGCLGVSHLASSYLPPFFIFYHNISSFKLQFSHPPLTVKKKFWIKSGYSVIIIYNETVERGCDKWAEIMKKESITN